MLNSGLICIFLITDHTIIFRLNISSKWSSIRDNFFPHSRDNLALSLDILGCHVVSVG